MIHETPRIDRPLQAKLDRLDALRAELAHEVGSVGRWDGLLRREALIDAVTSSASIEGYTVERTQADGLMQRSAPPADDESQWAVACYARAMEHIAIYSDDPSFAWSDRVILDLHFDACVFQRDRRPGRWRTGPAYVARADGSIEYEAPPAKDVVPRMAEVVTWLASGDVDLHVAVRAAMAHLHVVSVHPFHDGNGRISRLVQSLVLARDGVLASSLGSIEPYLAAHTEAYYRQLQQAHGPIYDPTIDAYPWVDFCVDAHIAQASRRIELVADAGRRWNALEAYVSERGWPDRLVIALEGAATGLVDRRSYVEQSEVSTAAASLDFRRLVDAELIVPVGSGRSSAYRASPRLEALIRPSTT